MVRVKICGITSVRDAMVAVRSGADALGFVFWHGSPRCVDPGMVRALVAALPPFVTTVGLFVDAEPAEVRKTAAAAGVQMVQLHGRERPRQVNGLTDLRVIKAIRVASAEDLKHLGLYRCEAYLLDSYVKGKPGGTGESFDWELARQASLEGPVLLAGGLNPDNVEEAIRTARPYGVDVSSGVEESPGVKDKQKVREFVRRAKSVALY
jgi:phosphoribosylanthranilate isomerase